MQHDSHVYSVFESEAEQGFLGLAIAAVGGMRQDGQVRELSLQAAERLGGVVLAAVIDGHEAFHALSRRGGNPVEDLFNRGAGIVCRHQNEDVLRPWGQAIRHSFDARKRSTAWWSR